MKSLFEMFLPSLACILLACTPATPSREEVKTGPPPLTNTNNGGSTTAKDRATPAKLSVVPRVETAAVTGVPESLPFHLEVKASGKAMKKGLHSFAFGQNGGKWLFVGGRTNGFHRTSTKASTFPTSAANQEIVVFDPATGETLSRALPAGQVQLRASNMQHVQDGDWLYIVGGYGSSCAEDKRECYQTYPKLTAINVPDAIKWVTARDDKRTAPSISSIEDECFRVTGGMMHKVGDFFYLAFGHNYTGVYSDNNVGTYTEEIRRFRIGIEGGKPVLRDKCKASGDPAGKRGTSSQFHRRDLTVTKGITPSGRVGLSVWGGVFTADDGAWVNPIFIEPQDTGEPTIQVDSYAQKTNLYDCANLMMFDPRAKVMYTTLFGGISGHYYDRAGKLVPGTRDNYDYWLPFTNIISTMTRSADGVREYVQPVNQGLPQIMGANAAFVLASGTARYDQGDHEIVDYAKLPGDESVLLGYIVGGIRATASRATEDDPTYANDKLYEVRLRRH